MSARPPPLILVPGSPGRHRAASPRGFFPLAPPGTSRRASRSASAGESPIARSGSNAGMHDSMRAISSACSPAIGTSAATSVSNMWRATAGATMNSKPSSPVSLVLGSRTPEIHGTRTSRSGATATAQAAHRRDDPARSGQPSAQPVPPGTSSQSGRQSARRSPAAPQRWRRSSVEVRWPGSPLTMYEMPPVRATSTRSAMFPSSSSETVRIARPSSRSSTCPANVARSTSSASVPLRRILLRFERSNATAPVRRALAFRHRAAVRRRHGPAGLLPECRSSARMKVTQCEMKNRLRHCHSSMNFRRPPLSVSLPTPGNGLWTQMSNALSFSARSASFFFDSSDISGRISKAAIHAGRSTCTA